MPSRHVPCAPLACACAPASRPRKRGWVGDRDVEVGIEMAVCTLVACDSAKQAPMCPWALACHSPAMFAIPRLFAVVLLK